MFTTADAIAIATAMATMHDMISKYFGYVSAIVMNPRDLRLAMLADTIPRMVPYMARLVIIACLLVVAPLGRAEDTSITCGNNLEYACSGGAEYARLGSADGQVRTDIPGLDVNVDSGCTSTSIPEEVAHLFETKTINSNPNKYLYIANDAALPIVRVVETKLPVTGFRVGDESSPVRANIPISKALIVRGMKKDMILLSTRGMKSDNVNTYLNDDNSIKRSECLLIVKDKIVVDFIPSGHAYNITLGHSDTAARASAPRDPTLVHSGMGHAGHHRLTIHLT